MQSLGKMAHNYSKLTRLGSSTCWHTCCYIRFTETYSANVNGNFFEEGIMNGMSSGWRIGAIAFLSGVALGIAGGLLWAPQSGKRTREDLQDLATDAFDQAEHWMETAKESVDDLMEKGKTAVKA